MTDMLPSTWANTKSKQNQLKADSGAIHGAGLLALRYRRPDIAELLWDLADQIADIEPLGSDELREAHYALTDARDARNG